jgi:probable HAF family extracellular repeat protein
MNRLVVAICARSRRYLPLAFAAAIAACGGSGEVVDADSESPAGANSVSQTLRAPLPSATESDNHVASDKDDRDDSAKSCRRYRYFDLGTLGGTDSAATGINNAGKIVGSSMTAGNASTRATLWSGGTVTDLGTLAGTDSYARDINNAGQVVGSSMTAGNASTRATLWSRGTVTDLGTIDGNASNALDINDRGQIVGSYWIDGTQGGRAVLWNGGTITELGVLGGGWIGGQASGINNSGLIVGTTTSMYNDDKVATSWTRTRPTQLVGSGYSFAYGVNNAGQIVGTTGSNPVSFGQASVWNGTNPTILSGLFADPNGRYAGAAVAINNSGQIVGHSATSESADWHAVLWNGMVPTDLNSFLDEDMVAAGWVLVSAADINDKGWIVGAAQNKLLDQSHAFLLYPVPAPKERHAGSEEHGHGHAENCEGRFRAHSPSQPPRVAPLSGNPPAAVAKRASRAPKALCADREWASGKGFGICSW